MGTRALHRFAACLAALVALTAAAGCSDDSGASGGDGTTVRMAVTDLQGLEELQREFGAFKETFEETSGMSLEFFAVNDRVAAAAALESDNVDVVFTGPAEYVVLNERTDASPIIAIRRPDYRSCIYTRADSDIAEPADLAGTTIGMSDVGSTSGHLGPSQLVVDAGFDPLEDVEVLTLGDAPHEALKRGDVDAVGIGCHDYEEFMESDEPADYRMVVEGPSLPPDVLLVREGLDPEVVDEIRTTFEENFEALLASMLEGKDNAKYEDAELVVVDDGDYDVVRSMYEAIGVSDFSEFVGD